MPAIKEEIADFSYEFSTQGMMEDKNSNSRKFSCSSNESSLSSSSSDYQFEHLQFVGNIMQQQRQQAGSEQIKRNPANISSPAASEVQLSDQQQAKIQNILDSVQALSDAEKFFLYLKLPMKEQQHSVSLSNSKWEQTQAFQWIRHNLEECDSSVNLPKHEVYDEYKAFCEKKGSKRFLSAPDFGKIVKCMFPNVKARRLGTRGNSKYCYNGLQKKLRQKDENNETANSAEFRNTSSYEATNEDESIEQAFASACKVVCEWANKLLGRCFDTLLELAKFLVNGSYVSTKSMAAFIVMSASQDCIDQINSRFNLQKLSPSYSSASSAANTIKAKHCMDNICTPSKTVMGLSNTVNNVKRLNNHIPHQSNGLHQVVPTPTSFNNTYKEHKNGNINLDEFTIDVSAPVFLEEPLVQPIKHNHTENIVLNNINVHIKEEAPDHTSDPSYQPATPPLTPKREEKRAENLAQQPYYIQSTVTPISPNVNKTPRKVGRPRNTPNKKNKSSPYGSPVQRGKQHHPMQSANMLPTMPPPSPINGFINRFNPNWSVPVSPHQRQPQGPMHYSPHHLHTAPVLVNCGSPCDTELQNIFINGPQTPPNHRIINLNNRCQSVPVSHNGATAMFQPLTPQLHRITTNNDEQTFNAKRNLNFMFENPNGQPPVVTSQLANANNNSLTSTVSESHDRVVPGNNQSQRNVAYQQQTIPAPPLYRFQQQQQHDNIYDLGFALNDLSTPEEMGDIPSGLDNIDGDDLIKSLDNTTDNSWMNDWSNSTIPLMNIS